MKQRMEHFPEKNPNPVLSVEKNGTVLYSNEAGKLLLNEWGVKVGEKLPSYIEDLVQRVIARNIPEKLEVKAGNRVYLISLYYLPEEESVNIYGFDISDQKEFEGKLRESEEKYRDLIETAIEGIWILDAEFRTDYVNKKMSEILGYSQKEMIDRFGWDFTDEEGKAIIKQNMEKRRQGINEIHEIKFIHKDGSFLWVHVSSKSLFDNFGKFTGVLGMLTDITERKRAEEALQKAYEQIQAQLEELQASNEELQTQSEELKEANRALVESEVRFHTMANAIPQLAWIAQPDGSTTWYNDRWYAYTGTTPEQMEGWGWQSVHDPTVLPKVLEQWKASIATGQLFDIEFPLRGADGIYRMFLTRAFPLKDEKGKVLQWFGTNTDITERKQMEDALKKARDNLEAKIKERTVELEEAYESLKESERGLAEAQEIAHIGNWERNYVTNKLHFSDELYRIFGLKPQELEVTYGIFLNYIHPDDRDIVNKSIKGALNGKPFNIDHRIILANGEEHIVHAKGEVVFDEKNNPVRFRGIVQDITDLRKIEERLRESEEKYRNIVETANEGISINDDEGIITFVNQKMADINGYNIDEIIGRKIWDFVGNEDQSTVTMNWEKRRRGFNASYDVKLIRKDGSQIWVYINSKPLFDGNGNFMGSLNMHTDITERKLLEEQTRQRAEEMTKVLDVAPVAILIGHDPQSHNITGNQTSNELFETEVGENISASTTSVRRFFCKGRELTADELPMQKATLKNIDVRNVEFDMLLPSGECRSLMGSASPLHDADEHVRGSVGAFMDITERKQAEETLRNFEIARHKEIHHRIKNNLQVIYSLLDLQAEKFKGRKNIRDSEVLNAFKESMDRVLSIALIHEELYKGENIDVINFSQYIKELADSLLLTYRLKTDINLNFDLDENLYLDMDTAIPLGIVINEIVSNSFKYAFSGRDKGEIKIILHREENEECKNEDCKSTAYVLSVSDNGIGIPRDLDIENLDSLGLQLVTTLVDQLDGELELKRDNGTEFTIRFTVTEKNNQATEAASQLIE